MIINNKAALIIKSFIALLIIVFAFYKNFSIIGLEDRPGKGYDEVMWTGSSIASYYMFFEDYKRKNFVPERTFMKYSQKHEINPQSMPFEELQWYDDAMWTFGWKAPNVAKYMFGWWIITTADSTPDPQGYFHEYKRDKTNKWPGNYVPENYVYKARQVNAFINSLTIFFLVIGLWYFTNFYIGAISGVYLVFNDLFMRTNTAVGLDGPAVFFSMLCIFLLTLFFKQFKNHNLKWKWVFLYGAGIGILFSLAVGSKLSGGALGFVMFPIFALAFYKLLFASIKIEPKQKNAMKILKEEKQQRKKKATKLIISSVLIIFFTFFLFKQLHPGYKNQTINKIQMIRESVSDFFDTRAKDYTKPWYKTTEMNDDTPVTLYYMFKRYLLKVEDKYYGTLGNYVPGLDLILFLLGLVFFIKKIKKELKDTWPETYTIIGLTLLIVIYANAQFIWVDWGRYFVPGLFWVTIVIAAGAYFLGTSIYRKLINQISNKTTMPEKAQ